jgi:UDP-N-acetylmuramate dehydrogenase
MNVSAEQFVVLEQECQLAALSADHHLPRQKKVLGGGSNILLTQPVGGLVVANRLKGIQPVREDADYVWLEAMAGEVWHDLVAYAISHGWGGLENLAWIPGTVGAAPIQNIGAYGVEVGESIEAVQAWHWQEAAVHTYTRSDCRFGYRDSLFKHRLQDQVLITRVLFRLRKKPVFHTGYGAINAQLAKMQVPQPTLQAVAAAVTAIRRSKLPDPRQVGNAGSFFKNPVLPAAHFQLLQKKHPSVPAYPASSRQVKVPAAWLIEQCGWKGYRKGDAGVHERQALVLVNYGQATGGEIQALALAVMQSVRARFGILLEQEVQVW